MPQVFGHLDAKNGLVQSPLARIFSQCFCKKMSSQTFSSSWQASQDFGHFAAAHGLEQNPFSTHLLHTSAGISSSQPLIPKYIYFSHFFLSYSREKKITTKHTFNKRRTSYDKNQKS